MAVMTQAQAKKFVEMDDKMLDVLDYLRDKGIIDEKMHRKILLEGYSKLVDFLEKKKIITGKDRNTTNTRSWRHAAEAGFAAPNSAAWPGCMSDGL